MYERSEGAWDATNGERTMTKRERYRRGSNNKANTNQNICTQSVCEFFGCAQGARYLHTASDVVSAIRKQFTVRSRFSKVKGKTVGGARRKIAQSTEREPTNHLVMGYIATVPGHVLLLDGSGKTIVDTAARKSDRRKLDGLWVVYLETVGPAAMYTLDGKRLA